jgi:glycosyltransferase involved in cell wall biosynthesis
VSKIVHLITSLEGGGTENFLYQILAHSPAGYEHQVLYLKKDGVIGDRLRQKQIPVRASGGLVSLFQTLQREKPDLLHTCLYSAHILGRCLGRLAGVPAIVTSQRAIDIWQQPWQRWLDTWTLPLSSAVIVNSKAAGQLIEARKGRRTTPEIIRIPNAVDTDRFKPRDPAMARARYELPLDALVGGSLLRLHPEKGADFIPHFAALVMPAHPRLHLLIGGVGPLSPVIQAQLASTDYRDRIHFVGWEDDTPAFLSACDFFWSLSREESYPQTLVEATVMGLPWVAPDTGGVTELLSLGSVGKTYTRLDIADAARQTAYLLRELPGQANTARRAAISIIPHVNLPRMISQIYAVFERFCTIARCA